MFDFPFSLLSFGDSAPDPPPSPPAYEPPETDDLAFLTAPPPTLAQMVLIALFSDKRANDDDVLPVAGQKQGWWADTYDVGYPVGSKLWLLDRAVVNQASVNAAQDYANAALQFLIGYGIASAVDVAAQAVKSDNAGAAIGLSVTVTRPDGKKETFRFADIWTELGG